MRYVQHGWPIQSDESLKPYWTRKLELSTEAGCLVWCGHVVVPLQGRESVVTELHAGHPGVSRMKSLDRSLIWWPGLDADIENAVKQSTVNSTSTLELADKALFSLTYVTGSGKTGNLAQ